LEPRVSRLLAQAAIVTIPLIAWSRDIAVVTLALAMLSSLSGPRVAVRNALFAPATLAAALLLAWSAASLLWAPHLPWETWLKTGASIVLSTFLAVFAARQSEERTARAAHALLIGLLALAVLLALERFSNGFFVGLHREAETVFQRLTTLSGGLVLLCTTCFAGGLLLARYLGALIALPIWTCAVLGLSLAYPMDAEVAAVASGTVVLVIVLVCGRAAAVTLMGLMALGMVGWGFFAESAAGAGLHHWLMANVDPNWGYRVEIWRYVSELIEARLFNGYGFDASRVIGQSATLIPSFEGKTSFLHPHNGMLQVWLELGLVGVTLLLATAVFGFRALLQRKPSRLTLAVVCATLTTSAVIWSLSFGAWQGWWLAVLGLTATCTVIAVRSDGQAAESRRKRLLFLVTEYYFFDALKTELTKGALEQGFEIVVAGRCRLDDVARAPSGITVIPFDWKRSPSFLVSMAYFIPDLVRVGRLFNDVRPDVLHNIALKPSVVGSLAAMGRRMRVVNAIHGFGFLFMKRTPLARVVQAVCGIVLNLSSRLNDGLVLVINRHDLALVRDRIGVAAGKIRLMHGTGIDLVRFTPLPDPPRPFRFLVIGRLLYMKGTDIVVEAHRLLRERGLAADLVICGSPDPDNPSSIPEEKLSEWAKRPGITFAGQVADVRPFLASCHVLIHPSLGGEGLPRALTEAAASQRALIATDIPGNTEVLIPNVTGLLVPPGSATALSDAMQWMMEHETERLDLARAGRAMMEREFASGQVAIAHGVICAELITSPE
jgi:glycosyltransferase involved in cell wall biosynthesis/O-antigen ligase